VAYHESGEGQPILFLHNAGNDHRIWSFQLDHFAQTHRVIGVDSLGYGSSERPKIDYTLPLYTEMVAAIVESLSLAPVTIVATCTGAAMALNYTLQHPENVKRLILFHIATERTVSGGNIDYNCRLFSRRPGLARAMAPMVEALMTRGFLQKPIIRGQYGTDSERDNHFIEHLRQLYREEGLATCLVNLFSNWHTFAVLDHVMYPSGFPPLHVIWGSANKVIRLERGRELCRKLGPSTFDVVDGAGHLVMREQPDAVNRRIEEFLSSPQYASVPSEASHHLSTNL
jgi:pimeloyl-ACP methyl ester carboxylesterase